MEIIQIKTDDLNEILKLEDLIFDYDRYNLNSLNDFLLNENYISLCAKINKKIVGYIIAFSIYDEGCIIKIATHPGYLKSGIATKLFNSVKELLKNKFVEKIYLEVNSNNLPAIEFYKKNGFLTENVRKSYYNNGDDALIMWLRDL